MKFKRVLIASLLLSTSSFALAQEQSTPTTDSSKSWYGIGLTADYGVPFGLGLAYSYAVLPDKLNARVRYNFGYDYKFDTTTENGFAITPKAEFETLGIFADWFPFEGGFRVTGGLGYMSGTKISGEGVKSGTNKVTFTSTDNDVVKIGYEGKTYEVDATKEYTVNGKTYGWDITSGGVVSIKEDGETALTADQLSTVAGSVKMNVEVKWRDIAPYIGIGYGNPAPLSGGWSFFADVGAYITGKPKISSSATATCNQTGEAKEACQALVQEMNAQADEAISEVRDDINKVNLLPYLSLGVSYAF